MNFLVRLVINAIALWLATRLVDGISFDGELIFLLVVALVFGAVNAIVKPILIVLTFPFLIVTLGLFLLVLNGVMIWLTGAVSDAAELGFHVSGFRAAFLGGLVVSVVSFLLSLMVGGDSRKKSER
ncbi:MAG TPA: phage holin family protein [Vicinamibacterales bacterium]|jgi:putative membrane protein|nr:phage holin family protein [Vicinamibacterales bacterium]